MKKKILGMDVHYHEGPNGVAISVFNRDAALLKKELGEKVKITLSEFEGYVTLMTSFSTIEEAIKFLDGDTAIRQVA